MIAAKERDSAADMDAEKTEVKILEAKGIRKWNIILQPTQRTGREIMHKSNGKFKQVTIRLDEGLWKRLKILAVESGMFVNALVAKDLEKLVMYKEKKRGRVQ